MSLSFLDYIKYRSFIITICALIIGCLVLFKLLEKKIINALTPELEKKAMVLGQTSLSPIYKAISLGIPYNKLRGIENHFEEIKQDNKEIKYLAFVRPDGTIISFSGTTNESIKTKIKEHELQNSQKSYSFGNYRNTKTPLIINDIYYGSIHLGVDPEIISKSLSDISYDALTVLFISLLVTFEFLLFVLNYRINGPVKNLQNLLRQTSKGQFKINLFKHSRDEIGQFVALYKSLLKKTSDNYHDLKDKFSIFEIAHQEDPKKITTIRKLIETIETDYTFLPKGPVKLSHQISVNAIRIPLFIFVFAESLAISFLPILSSMIYEPIWGLPKEVVIILPIVFFMAIYAISQPFSGIWMNFFSKRAIFALSGLCTTLGLLGSAFSTSITHFILWRMLTAVGYGTVLLTSQGYILDLTSDKDRGKGMSVYISAFYSGTVCGSAVGSILADNLGFQTTFVISSVIALVSAFFLWFYIREAGLPRIQRQFPNGQVLRQIVKNKSFMSLTFLISIPSRVISVSFIYYIVPVYLSTILKSSQSTIGRIIMAYGFMTFLLAPISGKLNDKFKNPKTLIALGALVSGLSCLPILFDEGVWGILGAVILLGISHGCLFTVPVANCSALVPNETRKIGAPMIASIFRFFDFQGYFIGTLIASVFVSLFDYKTTMVILATFTFIFGFIFYVLTPKWEKN